MVRLVFAFEGSFSMDGSIIQTYLSDVLHVVAQSLLAPDIILLLVLIGYALFCIGSVIAELFSERRHFKVAMPQFLAELMAANQDDIPDVIRRSGLLNRQKIALLTVYDYRILPGDALMALIRRLVSEEETRSDRITGRNNMAARIAPMLGLMGTLIPLGPGIQALGKADTAALSSSLLVAFDTTVAGLVAAAVCLVVGKIRSNWYGNYMNALDSAMATMLQKIEDMRSEGLIQTKEPTNYAFLFESELPKRGRRADGTQAGYEQDQVEGEAPIGLGAVPAAPAPATIGNNPTGPISPADAPAPAAEMPFGAAQAPAFDQPLDPLFATPAQLAQPDPLASSNQTTGPLPQVQEQQAQPVAPEFNFSFEQPAQPFGEVPMPAFLDTLTAPSPFDPSAQPAPAAQQFQQPVQPVAEPQPVAQPAPSGWYQPQQQGGGYAQPVSSWETGRIAMPNPADERPAE